MISSLRTRLSAADQMQQMKIKCDTDVALGHQTEQIHAETLAQRVPTAPQQCLLPIDANKPIAANRCQLLPTAANKPIATNKPTATNCCQQTNCYQQTNRYQLLPTNQLVSTAANCYQQTNWFQPLPTAVSCRSGQRTSKQKRAPFQYCQY